MKAWLIILALLVATALVNGQNNETPINSGILQSDLNAAGFKILSANLADYAGTNMTWNVVTGKFDATGGGSGSPGGSTAQFQYNNAGAFGGISSVTYDGTTPITVSRDGGANNRFTGIKLVNPTNAISNSEGRQAPAIHLIENIKDSGGTLHTYDHMIWGEQGSLLFGTSVDGSAVGGTGNAIVGIDAGGSIFPFDGDQRLILASVYALDWVSTGGDASHQQKVGMFNDSTPSTPGLGLANNGEIRWDAGPTWSLLSGDTTLTRSAAGVVKVKNVMELTPTAVAALPTGVLGRMAVVNDGAAGIALGATVTGGGSTAYLVWWNGANWTVASK